MDRYFLKRRDGIYAIFKKVEILDDDDFSYTEDGDNLTLTEYVGDDTDVKIVFQDMSKFALVNPTEVVESTEES